MLGRYIKIDNVVMPNPIAFSYTYDADESVYKSEAGTELSNIRRLDRLSFSATFNCSSRLKDSLVGLCMTPSVDVQIDNGAVTSGRLRLNGDIELVENSEKTGGTQGLWTVRVQFQGE